VISSIFDHVHLLKIEKVASAPREVTIKLVFYQIKRHMEKLKRDADKAAERRLRKEKDARIEAEKEAER
jgi:hypothetical protein